jgi:hypothetical protein
LGEDRTLLFLLFQNLAIDSSILRSIAGQQVKVVRKRKDAAAASSSAPKPVTWLCNGVADSRKMQSHLA